MKIRIEIIGRDEEYLLLRIHVIVPNRPRYLDTRYSDKKVRLFADREEMILRSKEAVMDCLAKFYPDPDSYFVHNIWRDIFYTHQHSFRRQIVAELDRCTATATSGT